jgi:hypothetical protein
MAPTDLTLPVNLTIKQYWNTDRMSTSQQYLTEGVGWLWIALLTDHMIQQNKLTKYQSRGPNYRVI